MKKGKPDKKQDNRVFTQLKDIIPDKLAPSLKVREARQPKQVEPTPLETLQKNTYVQNPLFEDWPADEVLNTFDFGFNTDKPFTDPTPLLLPPSINDRNDCLVSMKRYKDYLAAYLEDDSIAVSKKKLTKQNTIDLGSPTRQKKSLRERAGTIEWTQDRLDISEIQFNEAGKPDIKMCEYRERPETPEEAEERKKREESVAKGKKKPPVDKKKQVEEENLQNIKEPMMGFVSLKGPKPEFSTWIGSVLQMVKDRDIKDCYTNKTVLKNIYPQQDGLPIYNPSGRYWVKLYYLGKARKVEVDDVLPFDGFTFRFLFPMAEYANILWPLILTKAIYKLLSFKWKYGDESTEVGETAVLHCLTGLLPCTYSMDSLSNKETLSTASFFGSKSYALAYCSRDKMPFVPSNQTDKKTAFQQMSRQFQQTASPLHHDRREINQNFFRDEQDQSYLESNIKSGYAYSLFDCFTNGKFNMVYVQKIPDWEIKMRKEYLEALKETTAGRKTKEQILEIRKKRKELKARIKEEDKKRMDMISRDPLSFRLVKLGTTAIDHPSLNVLAPFTEEEIYTARKCTVNKLNRPPNYYEFYEDKKDDKSNLSGNLQGTATAASNQVAAIENSISAALKPLTDFSKISNVKEPENRGKTGVWMVDSDFTTCFDCVQVYLNPCVYEYLSSEYFSCDREKMFNFKPEGEIILMEEMKEQSNTTDPNHNSQSDKMEESVPSTKEMQIVFSFNSSPFREVETLSPHCILEKFDFDTLTSVSSYKTLVGPIDSLKITKTNENSVFRAMSYCPTGYSLTIASNAKPRFMSIPQYLVDYERWQEYSFNFDYKSTEQHKYSVIARVKIEGEAAGGQVLLKMNAEGDKYFKNHCRIRMLRLPEKPGSLATRNQQEGLFLPGDAKTYSIREYNLFEHKAGERYLIMVDFFGDYSSAEAKNEIKATPVDSTDIYEYMDKYQPYKYGIIFRERLFVHNPEVLATFRVEMLRSSQALGVDDPKSVMASPNLRDKKPPAKGTNPASIQPLSIDMDQIRELDDKKMIYLELFEENELKERTSGFNEVTLLNAVLKGDKSNQTNYYLQARFELREVPECTKANEFTQGLVWNLSVSSTDTVAIVKDTQKEEKERQLIDSWEQKEPGRKDKAKNCRALFEARRKQKEGLELTEEEEKLINEPKETKYSQEEQNKKGPGGKPAKGQPAAAAPKKGAAIAGKKDGKDALKEEESKKEFIAPKSEDHIMTEVKDFLEHMERQRVSFESSDDMLPRVRTDKELEELSECCLMAKEDAISILDRNARRRAELKNQREEVYIKKIAEYNESIEQMKQKFQEFHDAFNNFNNDTAKKRENNQSLVTILEAEQTLEPGLRDAINKSKEQGVDSRLIYVAEKYLKNAVIKNAITNLKEKLDTFDEPGVKQAKEFIESENIQLDEELQLHLEDFYTNIEANPNYIQEKLAELKKQPKKKK